MEEIDFVVEKTNLYEQIVDALEGVIIQSNVEEKLPSEQELSRRFGVSKAVIREAMKVLKDRGLIQSRNGDGSYISRPGSGSVANAVNRIIKMDNISSADLHGTRLILETAAVRLAALYARPEDLDHLDRTIEKQSGLSPYEEWIRYDRDFHIALARAGGNALVAMFVEVMMNLLKEYMFKGYYNPDDTIRQHREIVAALRGKDEALAEKAMLDHLFAARQNVFAYEEKIKKG
ncbi:MAG: FadR family transcriptional regulator [Treponema sp.]|jgi:DNA-binding FadR family transcriptional regulator|nr:FadR family transcriptional regulator [Treponema sp.]